MNDPSLHAARRRIQTAYDPATFSELGQRLIDALTHHFQRVQAGTGPVLNWHEPATNVEAAHAYLASSPEPPHVNSDDRTGMGERFSELIEQTLARGQNLHHPLYLGHQVPASLPIAALFDAVSSATNQVMAIYEMGPWVTAVETAMIEHLGAVIGFAPGTFSGICTHGGSLANLTALLTARNRCLDGVWNRGLAASDAAPVLVVQNDVHYCVTRAAGILGLGTDQVIKVPIDAQRKMRADMLDDCLRQLRRDKRPIVAVVAGACATPIGAFDPLVEIAKICRRHDVWLHVDAAHGGSVLLSDRHRSLVDGLHEADSVVWDAHKMLFMPALSAFLFYRRAEDQFATFQQDAPYLFDPMDAEIARYDSGTRTIECTKRGLALGLWGTWSLFGRQLFTDLVDVTFERTRQLHALLEQAEDFESLHTPECNIQVFRYLPRGSEHWSPDELGTFQLKLRRKLIMAGDVYLVPIKIDGVGALRATIINPLTTREDLERFLEVVREGVAVA